VRYKTVCGNSDGAMTPSVSVARISELFFDYLLSRAEFSGIEGLLTACQ
jgi:hypothetical protein